MWIYYSKCYSPLVVYGTKIDSMRNLDQEDINDIKSIVEEVKNMAIKFDLSYDQGSVAELLYDVDMSMRAILEIINGPSGTVERMI